MIEEEGGIWGTLTCVDEVVAEWEKTTGFSLSA
jgi:hypothetical protein